jgi:hypothetical protein
MIKEISEDQFKKVKDTVSRADSAVKRVPISAIKVDEESLKAGCILVNGNRVKVTNGFFSKMGQMLNINVALTRGMIEKGDTRLAASLINGLKDYASKRKGGTDVMLIANLETRHVVDICKPGQYKRVTNDTLFDVTERILNDNSSLIVETVDFNPHTGKASINFLNSDEVGFAQAGKDEFFKFGFSITQTSRNTIVESYNQRLICSNGLRVSLGEGSIGGNRDLVFEDKFKLGGTSTEDIRIFLNKIEDMKKAGFVPGGFESSINKAVGTKASLWEVEQAWKQSIGMIDEANPDLKKTYQAQVARDYYRGYGETMARINRQGVDANSLNSRQKQFIKTGQSVWEIVNSMTFLGSNNSGIPMHGQHELKHTAGELFAKSMKEGYDLEFAQYAKL